MGTTCRKCGAEIDGYLCTDCHTPSDDDGGCAACGGSQTQPRCSACGESEINCACQGDGDTAEEEDTTGYGDSDDGDDA
ncbi:hypothetical protein HY629_02405 [Candidatus Uhrbacteria bacterium]|nr:hypothetical protein [Candidatus Uhrbacteria bacterium]